MVKEINFEEELKKLEDIVRSLESGNLSLNDSLEKYKEGIATIKKCDNIISKAEKEVAKISKEFTND